MPDFARAMIIPTETSGVSFVSCNAMRLTVSCGIFVVLAACATSQYHIEPSRDVACFQRAPVSLTQAIDAAERSEGKRVIDAEYNCAAELDCVRGNPGQYRITFFAEGRLSRIGICPATGVVQAPVEKGPIRRMLDLDFVFDWPESEMLRAGPTAARAPVTMQAAIAAAELSGGKAIAAHVKVDFDKARYVIELVEHSRVRIVSIDLQNGTVVQ
jgi:hypothetical protein